METEQQEDEQLNLWDSPAAVITVIFLVLMALGAAAFFGYQTWLFVNWILPGNEYGLMMKVLAVINFDFASYLWLAVGLCLQRWIQPSSRTLAVLAGIVDLLLSLGCSIIQIMIAQAERFGTNTDQNLVYAANAFIIVALLGNIFTLLGILHIQWPYLIGYHPPKNPKKRAWFKRNTSVQLAQTAQSPALPQPTPNAQPSAKLTREQEEAIRKSERDLIEYKQKQEAERQKALQEAYERGKQEAPTMEQLYEKYGSGEGLPAFVAALTKAQQPASQNGHGPKA